MTTPGGNIYAYRYQGNGFEIPICSCLAADEDSPRIDKSDRSKICKENFENKDNPMVLPNTNALPRMMLQMPPDVVPKKENRRAHVHRPPQLDGVVVDSY